MGSLFKIFDDKELNELEDKPIKVDEDFNNRCLKELDGNIKNEYQSCMSFKTPLGELKLLDSNNNCVELEFKENNKVNELEIYIDRDKDEMTTTKKFKSYIIRFNLFKMKLNEEYLFKFTDKWEFDGSDERVFTLSFNKKDKIIAFSFQDMNDLAELYHEEEKYYTAYFHKGNVHIKVIDKDKEYGYCCLTWVWDVSEHFDAYCDACVYNSEQVWNM